MRWLILTQLLLLQLRPWAERKPQVPLQVAHNCLNPMLMLCPGIPMQANRVEAAVIKETPAVEMILKAWIPMQIL